MQPAEGDVLLMAVLGSWGCCNEAPQAVWHKHQKCIVSQFWRLEAQDEVISRVVPSGGSEGETVPGLFAFEDTNNTWCICGLWRHLHLTFGCLYENSPLLVRIPPIGFRDHSTPA